MAYGRSPVSELRDWVTSHSVRSFDFINDNTSTGVVFVPQGAVEHRFQTPNDGFRSMKALLSKVFENQPRLPVSEKDVANMCCRVMCILVLIGRPELIVDFMSNSRLYDSNLPFDANNPPPAFPEKDLFDKFVQEQWKFCAPELQSFNNWRFEDDMILPFTHGKSIRSSTNSSTVYEVHVHEEHDKLVETGGSNRAREHRYALKHYRGRDAERSFQRETEAFMNITGAGSRTTPGMIGFYLSFRYRDTFNIVLEYAEEGTLEDFFLAKPNPKTGEDIYDFWASVLEIVKGMTVLHKQQLPSAEIPVTSGRADGGTSLQGWHQDLRPENILVCIDHGTDGYQRWRFKVADLALAHFRVVMEQGRDVQDFDSFGIQTYAPPECLGDSEHTQFQPHLVTNAVDIWALACIFSEVCAWVVHGIDGLRDFRSRRKAATDAMGNFRGGDCFHNGETVLPIVESQLRQFKRQARRADVVTGRIVDEMLPDMMEADPSERLKAGRVQKKVEQILKKAKLDLADAAAAAAVAATARVNEASIEDHRPSTGSRHAPSGDPFYPGTIAGADIVQSPLIEAPSVQSSGEWQDQNAVDAQRDVVEGAIRKLSDDQGHARERSITTTSDILTPPRSRGVGTGAGHYTANARSEEPSYSSGGKASNLSPQSERRSTDLPYLSVTDAIEYFINDPGSGILSTQLPYAHHLTELQNRDQVFVVDNSESMKSHRTELYRLFRLLAHMTKPYDPDKKLELFFLGSGNPKESRKPLKLLEEIIGRPFAGTTDLKQLRDFLRSYGGAIDDYRRLRSNVLTSMFAKAPKKKSLYIFTDGKLETGNDDECHYEIRALVHKLQRAEMDSEQIGLQFISFGEDPRALARLEELDRLCSRERENFDIVDTVRSDGNVLKMLLGAFKSRFDGDGPAIRTPTSPTPGASGHIPRFSSSSFE